MEFFQNVELSFEQAQVISRGLHSLAATDGVHSREEALIREFYDAVRPAGGRSYEDTIQVPFAMDEALESLRSKDQRLLFIKTAWLLAFADGKITSPERDRIAQYATALGISPAEAAELQAQVKEFLLSKLTHIKNTAALADISKSMKIL